jgi:hypothetical protein
MPMKRHDNNIGLVRINTNLEAGTKSALTEYAFRTRQTESKAIDTLVREGAMAFLGEDWTPEKEPA